jgi:hypothetical protein
MQLAYSSVNKQAIGERLIFMVLPGQSSVHRFHYHRKIILTLDGFYFKTPVIRFIGRTVPELYHSGDAEGPSYVGDIKRLYYVR